MQSNIEQDVPAIVLNQKIVAAVEQAVLQPMSISWTGRRPSRRFIAKMQIDGLRVLDDAETVREIAGIVETRATPVDRVVLKHQRTQKLSLRK